MFGATARTLRASDTWSLGEKRRERSDERKTLVMSVVAAGRCPRTKSSARALVTYIHYYASGRGPRAVDV